MFGLFPPNLGVAPPIIDTYPNGYKRYIHRYAPATSLQLGTVPYIVLPIFIIDPVLKHISSGGFVQSTLGWDVRFEYPNGVKIPHEDMWYDGGNGQKAAWIRLDQITAGIDIQVYCYMGKVGLTASEEDPTTCWAGYLASIEFATGVDKSNHGADLTLSGVTATTLQGQAGMLGGFAATILFAGQFSGGVPPAGADALITNTGDTLVTSGGDRIIFFLSETTTFTSGGVMIESLDHLLLENGDRLFLERTGGETSDWISSNSTSVGIVVELESV